MGIQSGGQSKQQPQPTPRDPETPRPPAWVRSALSPSSPTPPAPDVSPTPSCSPDRATQVSPAQHPALTQRNEGPGLSHPRIPFQRDTAGSASVCWESPMCQALWGGLQKCHHTCHHSPCLVTGDSHTLSRERLRTLGVSACRIYTVHQQIFLYFFLVLPQVTCRWDPPISNRESKGQVCGAEWEDEYR